MTQKLLAFLLVISPIQDILGQPQANGNSKYLSFPFTENHWTPRSTNVSFTDYKSRKVVKSSNEDAFEIILNDFDFSTGTIEFDVELKGRGFPGIVFHLDETTGHSETYYLRYFGKLDPRSRTTMQYAAVMDGVNLWDITDDYQAAARLIENEWNHIKLVIASHQMKVFVNDMNRAALHVPVLEGLKKTGKISLNGNVIYSNFSISPDKIDGVSSDAGFDPTYNDPNYMRTWQIQKPIDFPTGIDPMQQVDNSPVATINPTYFDGSKPWYRVKAKHRAMVNLTEEFGKTREGQRRLAWLKTTITTEKEMEKLLRMGFSDEVWVFINGQPLHQNKNYYGSPGMKEPRGRCTIANTAFNVPLRQGENELLIGVSNYFFGWGLIARWEDASGLQY